MTRDPLRVLAVQTGPMSQDVEANLSRIHGLLTGLSERPDLVVFPELFSVPFWCVGFTDAKYFSWAEDLGGPTVTAARKLARDLDTHVVTSFFERGHVAGEYYNSAAVIDPFGEVVVGRMPSGREVQTYRKCSVSSYRWDDQVNDEKFYFRPGTGYPVFPTQVGTLGILVCYDRWYPEAWRVLALQGAEIICVLNASQGDVSDLFLPSMRTAAAQNLVYVVATNRGGEEELEGGLTRYYGLTSVIGPRGDVLGLAGEATPDEVLAVDVDPDRVGRDRLRQTMYRDRRPELYGLLVEGRT